MSNALGIDRIVNHFEQRGGFARSHSFLVYIDLDGADGGRGTKVKKDGATLKGLSGMVPGDLTIQASSVELPSKGLLTKEIFTQNIPVPMGYNLQYSDLTVNFIMDNNTNNMNVWNFFNTWMNLIVNPVSAYVGYLNDYSCPIYVSTVNQNVTRSGMSAGIASPTVDRDSKPVNIKFHNAFPKTMGAVSMDASSTGETLKLPVTFAIKKFEDVRWDDWTKKSAASNSVTG